MLVMNNTIFWDITLCSPLKVNKRFRERAAFTLVSCLAYSFNLKMEVTCFSEMSVDFHQTTRHYIPEDRTLPQMISQLQESRIT
jgi:hypothetical protein